MTFQEWQETRQWADDLSPHVDADLGGASGFHYHNGHIEARGRMFGVTIETSYCEFETLQRAEEYLWNVWARDEING